MDVISLGKANKAKKNIEKLNTRLGEGIQDIHPNVRTRLEELEKRKPGDILNKRVSEIEAHTHINLNKHNLRVASLLNQNRYKHTDMVMDDFNDDSGIDFDQSVNLEWITGKVKAIDYSLPAEMVTVTEKTDTQPEMISISLLAEDKEDEIKTVSGPEVFVSRNNGIDWAPVEVDKLEKLYEVPDGTELKIKIVLKEGRELHAISYSWI